MGMEERMTLLYLFTASCKTLPPYYYKLRSYLNEHMSNVADLSSKKLPKCLTNSTIMCSYCHSSWNECADSVKVSRSNKRNQKIKTILTTTKPCDTYEETKKTLKQIQSLRNKMVLKCSVCTKKMSYLLRKSVELEKKENSLQAEARGKSGKKKTKVNIARKIRGQEMKKKMKMKAKGKIRTNNPNFNQKFPNEHNAQFKKPGGLNMPSTSSNPYKFQCPGTNYPSSFQPKNFPPTGFQPTSSFQNRPMSKKEAKKIGINPFALHAMNNRGKLSKKMRRKLRNLNQAMNQGGNGVDGGGGNARSLQNFLRLV